MNVLTSMTNLINKQFIVFLFVGSFNTLVGFLFYAAFIALGCHYSVAALFSTILGVIFNFFTTGKLVFQNTDKLRIVRFALVYGVVYFVNLGLIKSCLRLGLNEYTAYLVSIPFLALLSFFLMKQLVFADSSSAYLDQQNT